MITFYREFEEFIGEKKSLLRKSLVYTLFQGFLELSKIWGVFAVLEGLLAGTLTTGKILTIFGIVLFCLLGATFFKAQASMLQTKIGYGVAAEKRLEIGEHLKYVPMGFFSKRSLGRIVSIATNTAGSIHEVATIVLMQFTTGLIHGIIMTAMLLYFYPPVGFLSLLSLLSFYLIVSSMNRRGEELSRKKVEKDQVLTERVLEYIQGMEVVKSFGLTDDGEVFREIEDNRRVNTKLELLFIPYFVLQSLVLRCLSVGIVALTLWGTLKGTLTMAEGIVLIMMAFLLFNHIESAGAFASLLKVLTFAMGALKEMEDLPIMDEGGEEIHPLTRDVEFQNVSFSYGTRPVLKNVSFAIPEGSVTAIVGPSGSGKTTLSNLVARFWDPDEGRITLGGRNIKDYTLDSLWENLSMVFQNVILFQDTVENNIRFGRPEAPREEVIAAAKAAQCYDFIMELPQGFDTVLGEGGHSLSGGERQRISIARALMKDAPIVILDEATASVDPENEALLKEAIAALTAKKTVILIAHRLNTVRQADQILVMKEGQLEDVGTHDELMARPGTYREFVNIRKAAAGWKISR